MINVSDDDEIATPAATPAPAVLAETVDPAFEKLIADAQRAAIALINGRERALAPLNAALQAIATSGDTGAARLAELARLLAAELAPAQAELNAIAAIVDAAMAKENN